MKFTLSLHDALPIYCDFSGYTDIAIGSAALLGIIFPPNFASPYKAHNIIEFWRRWHISLSTWLRDRKSTRLNSSHLVISYAVFWLKQKNTNKVYHS